MSAGAGGVNRVLLTWISPATKLLPSSRVSVSVLRQRDMSQYTKHSCGHTHTIHTDEFDSVFWILNSCITLTGFMRGTFTCFTQALLCDTVGKDDNTEIRLSSNGKILKPLPAIYLHVSRAVLHPVGHGHQQLVVHHPLIHLDETDVKVHVELERKRKRHRCFHSQF